MNKKLTLRLDEEAIERAKRDGSRGGTSVSKLVQRFFERLEGEEVDREAAPGYGAPAVSTGQSQMPAMKPEKRIEAPPISPTASARVPQVVCQEFCSNWLSVSSAKPRRT